MIAPSAMRFALDLLIRCVAFATLSTLCYLVAVWLFHVFRVHERFGIFRQREPKVHFYTSLKNWRVPFLGSFGIKLASILLGIDVLHLAMTNEAIVSPALPADYVILHSPHRWTDVLIGVLGFYVGDLGSWVMHWLNHRFPVLYRKYPCAHFVHHNLVFLNPLAFAASPLVHLVAMPSLMVSAFLLSQGLVVSTFVFVIMELFSNGVAHLGCDPLPWVTRLNRRIGGWIPWIPVEHQYHHLPFVSAGNYGNRTCLWDYVFGTLVPECLYHIDHGHPLPEVAERMANGDVEMERFLRGKTRLSLG